MDTHQRVLFVDAASAFHRIERFAVGDPFFGPVDLGLHLSGKYSSLNIGAGLLAGSILPGSNRLVVTGYAPAWNGFYVSTMGGAALVFDNLGINMLSIVGRAPVPSVLYLNRRGGEHIEVELTPVQLEQAWSSAGGGIYGLLHEVLQRYGGHYETEPRILAVGPASAETDFGAIGSVPIKDGRLTHADTWAGRGGFGSALLQRHNVCAVIYGGTFADEDFRDRKVADQWFVDKYQKKLMAVDLEATTKYRFDPGFETGGTLGVNYAKVGGRILYFNYRSIFASEEARRDVHQRFIVQHYLKQFNQETIETKQQATCGEPCAAVCKKLQDEYKKDFEPYQTMGPLAGVFDQRAAERLNRHADSYGFDAISAGGVVSWLLECLAEGTLTPAELGVSDRPCFTIEGFNVEADSVHNAELGMQLLDTMIRRRGLVDMRQGARKFGRRLARDKGRAVLDPFVYTAFGRNGWMVPNQYWTPGVLAPMSVMGRYYMYYGYDFTPPRSLGVLCAGLMREELALDNLGFCRFHRGWAQEMIPAIIDALYGLKDRLLEETTTTVRRIQSRNAANLWESERCVDFVRTYLQRERDVEHEQQPELQEWLARFAANKQDAATAFWYEIHRGAMESLRQA
jgi:glyceraldehyde-3-phosphate dehydrogenase (ferredoxin)